MWPQYSYKNPIYLTLGENPRLEWSPELNRCELWRGIFGSVMDEEVMRNLRESEWAETMGIPRRILYPKHHFPHQFFREQSAVKYLQCVPNHILLKTSNYNLPDNSTHFNFDFSNLKEYRNIDLSNILCEP